MAKKAKKLTDSEIITNIDQMTTWSIGRYTSQLSSDRNKAMEYYLGLPYKNEQEGRSSIITRQVFETIERMLPQLIEIFVKAKNPVEFDPTDENDEEQAKQETEYCKYVFYKDNQGVLLTHNWFKDALLLKNGTLKVWWETSEEKKREEYEDLGDDEFFILMQNPELEPKEHTPKTVSYTNAEGMPIIETRHDAVFERVFKKGWVKIDLIPPEELFIARDSRSTRMEDQTFVSQITIKTATELLDLGYDKSKVDEIPTYSESDYDSIEKQTRNFLDDERVIETELDPSQRRIRVEDVYMQIDIDGDGRSELWRIVKADKIILEKEQVEVIPFVSITPIPLPHKFYGLSIADVTMDIQIHESAVLRQLIDNLNFQNNKRFAFDENTTNIDDLMSSRPSAGVRTMGPPQNSIMPLSVEPMGQAPYEILAYLDQMLEDRSGISRKSTTLDPNVLNNNKGDASIMAMMEVSKSRVELIARLFAETGFEPLFRLIRWHLRTHQDKERVVKLSGGWKTVNPADWKERSNTTINVGLGTGDRTKEIAGMMKTIEGQEKMVQGGGLGILVTPKNIHNAWSDMAKMMDIKDTDKYFLDPKSPESQQAQQQRAQQAAEPDINQQMLQLQAKIASQQLQIEQSKVQLNQRDDQIDAIQDQQRIDKDQAEAQAKFEIELGKLNAQVNKQNQDFAAKLTEMELKYNQNVPGSAV